MFISSAFFRYLPQIDFKLLLTSDERGHLRGGDLGRGHGGHLDPAAGRHHVQTEDMHLAPYQGKGCAQAESYLINYCIVMI